MKFKKFVALSTASIVAFSLLVGCSGGSSQGNVSGDNKIKIGMVADVGGINDESFNQSAWEGLQEAETDLDVEVIVIESNQSSEYLTNIDSLVDQDVDLIIGVGSTMKDDIAIQAENYPDKQFVLVDETYEEGIPENVTSITFRSNEAAYLTGLIAGKMTETNAVGFIGGMELPVIAGFEYGYIAGVNEANSDAEVRSQYAGTFGDAAKGKSIANQMYGTDVDIILSAAGGTGLGAIEAAREQNKYAIGVDKDQSNLAPNNILTSALKKVDVGVYDTVKEFINGNLTGGEEKVYGLKEDGVGIPDSTENLVPQEILDYVNDMIDKIKNDEIAVPTNKDEYEKMGK